MEININDRVKVKLTNAGKQVAIQRGFKATSELEDESGFTEWQLWTLMRVFGNAMNSTFDPVFESGIVKVGF